MSKSSQPSSTAWVVARNRERKRKEEREKEKAEKVSMLCGQCASGNQGYITEDIEKDKGRATALEEPQTGKGNSKDETNEARKEQNMRSLPNLNARNMSP